jgi:benzoyl-CoA reductase/2-hydroxyglutaryl-CoA dehydratase subunit BcrC/BadD/HgdB
MKKIGITTTVPIEILIAAGYTPVDLNNIFITSKDYFSYIDMAEKDGFPKSMCAWIKAKYGVCIKHNIEDIVGVVEGDCSNTKSLMEVLSLNNINIHPFSYPNDHKKESLKKEMDKFMDIFNVSIEEVEKVRLKLNKIRKLAKKIDELTYIENKATGFENHLYQVSSSDFNINIDEFEKDLINAIKDIENRKPQQQKIRLGYIGVPPMTGDIYTFVENFDARFVYNEVQREFAFSRYENNSSIYDQYYDYTYPYDIEFRMDEIKKQIEIRQLDGIIHYTQAFCHKAIDDIIFKQKLNIPILNIEGDKLNALDARTKLRIEAFLDMLKDKKEGVDICVL